MAEALQHSTGHELLALHQHGDRQAFAALVERFRGRVHNYLLRCGIDSAARDDLLQEIFFKIHRAAGSYQPERPLEAWIFTIATNTLRSHFRKRAGDKLLLSSDNNHGLLNNAIDPQAASALQQVEAKQAADWLADEVARLPLAQRQVLVLACVEGLAHSEVGGILELPVNTVKTHLRRARLALAKALARRKLRAAAEDGA